LRTVGELVRRKFQLVTQRPRRTETSRSPCTNRTADFLFPTAIASGRWSPDKLLEAVRSLRALLFTRSKIKYQKLFWEDIPSSCCSKWFTFACVKSFENRGHYHAIKQLKTRDVTGK